MKASQPIYIVEAARTPIGSPFKGLKEFSAAQLGVIALRGALRRAKVDKKLIDEVIVGNVVSAGTGQNIARQISLMAGLPKEVSAFTVNDVCGAALRGVSLAMQSIQLGKAGCVIAAGVESATYSPFLINREDAYVNKVKGSVDSLFYDGLYCQYSQKSMGELAEEMAKRNKVSRKEQDLYAFESNGKAVEAQQKGYFRKEIVPVALSKNERIIDDDRPRKNLKLESLEALPPAFDKKGTITAGSASVPSDGAAALILANERFVKKHKLKPKVKILHMASQAVDPKRSFESTASAIKGSLKQCGLSPKQIHAFDIGEAFAAQIVLLRKKIDIPSEKINLYGGDISLGHPLGCSGIRNLVTLINILQANKLSKGMAASAYGGGGVATVIVEAVKA